MVSKACPTPGLLMILHNLISRQINEQVHACCSSHVWRCSRCHWRNIISFRPKSYMKMQYYSSRIPFSASQSAPHGSSIVTSDLDELSQNVVQNNHIDVQYTVPIFFKLLHSENWTLKIWNNTVTWPLIDLSHRTPDYPYGCQITIRTPNVQNREILIWPLKG